MSTKLWQVRKRLENAKGWHWVVDHWEWFGTGDDRPEDDIQEALGKHGKYSNLIEAAKMSKNYTIELLTENNGWAIIYLHDKYFIRHVDCGTTLRKWAHVGCFCHQEIKVDCKCKYKNNHCRKKGCQILPEAKPVDPIIYGKFRMMTLRDPDLKRSLTDEQES